MDLKKHLPDVMSLDDTQRYTFSVKEICGREEVWTLEAADGFVQYQNESGQYAILVCPSIEFARLYIKDEWQVAKPTGYSLEEFLYGVIPRLIEAQVKLLVLPVSDFVNPVMTDALAFAKDLNDRGY